jgi:MFS family permease
MLRPVTPTAERSGLPARRAPRSRVEHGVPVNKGLVVLTFVAAVAAAISGAQPTGIGWLDAVWSAAFAVSAVLAASRARRLPTIWMAGIAGVASIGAGAAPAAFGVLALLGAAYIAFTPTRYRLVGALVGLVAAQALLRGQSYSFNAAPTLVAAAAVLPVFISAWRIGRSRERRIAVAALSAVGAVLLIGCVGAALATIASRPHLESASDSAERALDLLRAGDTETAAEQFSQAQLEFDNASSSLDGPLGYLGRGVPIVAQQLEALRRVSAAGEDLGAAASEAAATADWGDLAAEGGTIDLKLVATMQGPLAQSSAAIDDALATLADVRSPWLLAPLANQLDELETRLVDAGEQATIAADGVAVAPALLGGDGPRNYLVAFATPGETRNAGGFVGAFAVITADQGTLSLLETGQSMRDLRLRPDQADLDLTDEWQTRYGSYDVDQFPGNMSASPDWPTDAAVAAQIYERASGGIPIDGVIYADPAALAAFLELTGPVEVPGLRPTLTADNVEQYLLIDQYVQFDTRSANAERREVLGEVAGAVFEALVSQPLPGLRQLTDVLGPAVAGGHLRIASLGADDEKAFLRDANVDGAWAPTEGADLVSVRTANQGLNKIDVFLRRTVAIDTQYDPQSGAVESTVTVTLTNDAPPDGLPDYIIGNQVGEPDGTNHQLVTLYTPMTFRSVTVDGQPSGIQYQDEFGIHTYGVPIDIPPGGTVTVSWTIAGAIAPGSTYLLHVLPQPLANDDQLTVKVRRPGADAPTGPVFTGPLVEPLELDVAVQ